MSAIQTLCQLDHRSRCRCLSSTPAQGLPSSVLGSLFSLALHANNATPALAVSSSIDALRSLSPPGEGCDSQAQPLHPGQIGPHREASPTRMKPADVGGKYPAIDDVWGAKELLHALEGWASGLTGSVGGRLPNGCHQILRSGRGYIFVAGRETPTIRICSSGCALASRAGGSRSICHPVSWIGCTS